MSDRPSARPAFDRARPWLTGAAWLAGLVGLGLAARPVGLPDGVAALAALAWSAVFAVVFRTAVRNLFGPVFLYEVLRLGRRKSTILYRLLYVLAVMAVLGLMYASWLQDVRFQSRDGTINPMRQAEFAANFFYTFQVLQYALIVLMTPAAVAGCIADEKERKTLEFLLATDLGGQEIVFGKLAARVFTMLMYVLAGLPVVAFLQLFGGIDPDLLLAGTAAAVTTVLGLSAVSIAFSVQMKKPRDAIVLTYMAVFVYAVGSAILGGVLENLARATGLGPFGVIGGRTIEWQEVWVVLRDASVWFTDGNILYAGIKYLESSRGTVTAAGINSVLLKFTVFWAVVIAVSLLYAVARLRTIALRQAYGVARRVKVDKQGRAIGRWRNRPAIGADPMLWKEVFADGSRRSCLGTLLALLIGLLVFGWPAAGFVIGFGQYVPGFNALFGYYAPTEPFAQFYAEFVAFLNGWCRVATGVLSMLLLLSTAVRGAGAVSGERDRDTWISLISTPLTVGEMLWGKFFGVVLGQRKALGALLAVWAIALAFGAVEPVTILGAVIALAVYMSAAAWLGIFCSITAKKTLTATIRAILAAAFFGGGYLVVGGLCCMAPVSILFTPRDLTGEPFDSLAILALGLCPPLVMGWLPMHDLSTERELMMFAPRESALGVFAPLVGLVIWLAFAALLASSSFGLFAAAANRDPAKPLTPPRRP